MRDIKLWVLTFCAAIVMPLFICTIAGFVPSIEAVLFLSIPLGMFAYPFIRLTIEELQKKLLSGDHYGYKHEIGCIKIRSLLTFIILFLFGLFMCMMDGGGMVMACVMMWFCSLLFVPLYMATKVHFN